MAAAPLAPDLRRFVAAKIHSVPMLEALLLLHSRREGWTRGDLAGRLYLPDARVDTLVRELCRERLARLEDETVLYAPADAAIAALVDELAATYSRHVVAVTEIIHSGLERKARDFADAFVLRRDE
jgi:DNA primase large subunit